MEYHDSCLKPLGDRTSATDSGTTLLAWDVATVAALKVIPSINARDVDGTRTTDCMLLPQGREERIRVASMAGRVFAWHPTCALDGDDQLIIIPNDRNSAVDTDLADDLDGRWLAVPGQMIDMALPFTYATADAAVLYTMPTGARLCLDDLYWEITTACAGGSSSAIGVSTTKTTPTNWSTKGDLLGGSSGDVEATLIVGAHIAGTQGTDMDTLAKKRGACWVAGDVFRFDRITSVFTSGAGNVHVRGYLEANAGA